MNNEKNLTIVDQLLANAMQGLKEQLSQAINQSPEPVIRQERGEELEREMYEALSYKFENNSRKFVDRHSASFEIIYGNQIELVNVELNEGEIAEVCVDVVMKVLSKFITIEK